MYKPVVKDRSKINASSFNRWNKALMFTIEMLGALEDDSVFLRHEHMTDLGARIKEFNTVGSTLLYEVMINALGIIRSDLEKMISRNKKPVLEITGNISRNTYVTKTATDSKFSYCYRSDENKNVRVTCGSPYNDTVRSTLWIRNTVFQKSIPNVQDYLSIYNELLTSNDGWCAVISFSTTRPKDIPDFNQYSDIDMMINYIKSIPADLHKQHRNIVQNSVLDGTDDYEISLLNMSLTSSALSAKYRSEFKINHRNVNITPVDLVRLVQDFMEGNEDDSMFALNLMDYKSVQILQTMMCMCALPCQIYMNDEAVINYDVGHYYNIVETRLNPAYLFFTEYQNAVLDAANRIRSTNAYSC